MLTIEEKRQIYKILKKHKIFSKFCLGIAQAYEDAISPKRLYEYYLNDVVESYYRKGDNWFIMEFIDGIKSWNTKTKFKILP